MRFGIPEYRLPRTLLRAEIDKIVSLGVTLKLNTPLAAGFGLAELRAQGFDAVFLSVGVLARPRPAGPRRRARRRREGRRLPAERQPRLPHGSRPPRRRDWRRLRRVRRRADRAARQPRGRRDDARRRGRRAREGSARLRARGDSRRRHRSDDRLARELRRDAGAAHDAGARRVRGGAEGRRAVRDAPRPEGVHRRRPTLERRSSCAPCARSSTRTAASRRRTTTPTSITHRGGRLHSRDRPEAGSRFSRPPTASRSSPAGTIRVDPATLATSAPGVYAGGDVAFGPRNLIEAVANGKRAARSIHEYLTRGSARLEAHLEIEELPTSTYRMLAGFEQLDRETPPTLDLGRRTGIAEVETGYDRTAAARSRPRAASSATSRRSTTRRSACSATAAWTSARSTAWRSCRSNRSICRRGRARGARRRAPTPEPPAAHRDGERRRPLHSLRAVRHPLSDGRDDDGEVLDYGAMDRDAQTARSRT